MDMIQATDLDIKPRTRRKSRRMPRTEKILVRLIHPIRSWRRRSPMDVQAGEIPRCTHRFA